MVSSGANSTSAVAAKLAAAVQPASNPLLAQQVQEHLDRKTKPQGSLGRIEDLARHVALIQGQGAPRLQHPSLVIFAGDHGITRAGVSAYPQEVTAQMVLNFLRGGAAANVLARRVGMELLVVDAGVAADLPEGEKLVHAKIGRGTADFSQGPAMRAEQLDEALTRGETIVAGLARGGCNIVAFGEMGIGNTSAATCLMAALTGKPIKDCVGRGTGLGDQALAHKVAVLESAMRVYTAATAAPATPVAALTQFAGFEMAMMTGAILAAAARRMTILVDGFIASACVLAACRLAPAVQDYCIYSHCSAEHGHRLMLAELKAEPLLNLNLRLGEGTGAVLAMPLVEAAVAILNEMATFAAAQVSGPSGGEA